MAVGPRCFKCTVQSPSGPNAFGGLAPLTAFSVPQGKKISGYLSVSFSIFLFVSVVLLDLWVLSFVYRVVKAFIC